MANYYMLISRSTGKAASHISTHKRAAERQARFWNSRGADYAVVPIPRDQLSAWHQAYMRQHGRSA